MPQEREKTIAKNTMMLYVRNIVIMAITLYTSRVVLSTLGEVDFGIYNIVAGVVVLFSFISAAMTSATQRFMSYELGRGGDGAKLFNTSIIAHLLMALVLLVVGEAIGPWFVRNFLNLPSERLAAALGLYQFSLLMSCITLLRIPYQATIIAHEQMSFYAYISIIEALLKLGVVALLLLLGGDKLLLYGALSLVAATLTSVGYMLYCRRKIGARFGWEWDRPLLGRLMSFSALSLMGSAASVGATQGVAVVVNIFFGVVANAAMAIATQVGSAVYSFVSGFQTAFNPQIVKSYAAAQFRGHIDMVFNTSRYSYLLLYALTLPVVICCRELLELWLVEVPEHSVIFTQLMLLLMLTEALAAPLWMSVQAVGQIAKYQVVMSLILLCNIPIIYLMFAHGYSVEWALAVRLVLGVVAYIVRLLYLRQMVHFSLRDYLRSVALPCLVVTLLTAPLPYVLHSRCSLSAAVVVALALLLSLGSILAVGLNGGERSALLGYIKNKVR